MQFKSMFKPSFAALCILASTTAQAAWVKTTVQAMHTMGNGDVAIKIGALRESATITCERKSEFTILRSDPNFEQNFNILVSAKLSKSPIQLLDAGTCSTIPGWSVGVVNQIMLGDW